jgi:serine/threonine-protein kinase
LSDDTLIQFSSGPRVVAPPEAGKPTPLHAGCKVCGQRFGAQAMFCPFDGERLVALPAPSGTRVDVDPLLGVVVDERYRIESVLGSGGMGTVYEATHIVLARRMALKVLRHELAGQGDLSARFLREARAAASVEHPNVVRISDFGTLPSGQAYFVMELLSGTSLRSLVSCGPLEPNRVAAIAHQVADGLAAAHRAGIVHRDLKPDNIQIDPQAGDFVKVLDFGLARVAGTSRLTKEGVVFGTPQYMSPEQAAGELVDHRSDVYALGVMMYEMLTGRVPFEADTYMGVLTKHLRTPPVPPRVVLGDRDLGGLEPIVLRALEKSPGRRFSNMTELMMALDQRGAARVEPRAQHLPIMTWGERPGVVREELDSAELRQVAGLPTRAWPRMSQVPRWLAPAALGASFACVTMAWVLHERTEVPPALGTSEVARISSSTAVPLPAVPQREVTPAEFSGGQSLVATQAALPAPVQLAPPASAPPSALSPERAPEPGLTRPLQAATAKVTRPAVSREVPKTVPTTPPATEPKRRKKSAGEIIDPWADDQ